MKLHSLFIACVLAAGCGSKNDGDATPPPAVFSDATTDTGKKDTGAPGDSTTDSTGDVLLADASDVMAPDCVTGKTCVGSDMPTWKLEDFQPKSTRYRTTYGLDAFKGKVTVVALLSGW
jgi:hypothetical protein